MLKKVAGLLRSMLCMLQTWNLFGRGSVVLRTIFLGGSEVGNFSRLVFFLFPAHRNLSPLLAEKVAGFLRFMLCTLQIWNLFGRGSVVLRTVFLGGSEVGIFSPLFSFSFSSLQESRSPAH